jgi:hypothetical protein
MDRLAVIAKSCSTFITINRKYLLGLLIAMMYFYPNGQAQYPRRTIRSNIGWYNLFSTWNIHSKLGVHLEYQWRRDNFIFNWQQSLLRTGINYNLRPGVLLRIGYAWIETYNYGEIPFNSFGRDFTEHRVFEMLQLSNKEGRFEFTHRFMVEQRFIGKYLNPDAAKEEEFPLLNRLRYMFRIQAPLKGDVIGEKTPYLALYDEVMIGFGKNVNANVFDQNRIGALFGYRKSQAFAIEIGYLHQILQFGRIIEGKNVFQHNSGIILNILVKRKTKSE